MVDMNAAALETNRLTEEISTLCANIMAYVDGACRPVGYNVFQEYAAYDYVTFDAFYSVAQEAAALHFVTLTATSIALTPKGLKAGQRKFNNFQVVFEEAMLNGVVL